MDFSYVHIRYFIGYVYHICLQDTIQSTLSLCLRCQAMLLPMPLRPLLLTTRSGFRTTILIQVSPIAPFGRVSLVLHAMTLIGALRVSQNVVSLRVLVAIRVLVGMRVAVVIKVAAARQQGRKRSAVRARTLVGVPRGAPSERRKPRAPL